jgi:LPXTG-motif cell wall-anchored protein
MVRKIVAASVLSLTLTVGAAGVAGAQDSPGASVLPEVIERQPLPKTGSDIGGDVIVGLSLTAAGLAFAATARQRRRRLEATATAPTSTN